MAGNFRELGYLGEGRTRLIRCAGLGRHRPPQPGRLLDGKCRDLDAIDPSDLKALD